MLTIWPVARGFGRGIFAGVFGCLFFLQILAFVISPNVQDASVSTAREICNVAMHDRHGADTAPSPNHQQCPHCLLCVAELRNLPPPTGGLIASVVGFVAPHSDETAARLIHHDSPPPTFGWISSWSSRAPPPLA